ncbi:hypothetical protein B0O80DRAFT_496766 [Mortierella sp. GBAus27b]|nr:hypothetical protein BGX31_009723 [Mortierella sp. GBA43]KAI8357043.1 hypothetical protein B0O80DRAFT_496766 [Mortierella sp. GBAus27b]
MKLGDDDKVSGIGEYDLTSQRAYNNNSRKIDRQFLEMTLQRIKKSSTSALDRLYDQLWNQIQSRPLNRLYDRLYDRLRIGYRTGSRTDSGTDSGTDSKTGYRTGIGTDSRGDSRTGYSVDNINKLGAACNVQNLQLSKSALESIK